MLVEKLASTRGTLPNYSFMGCTSEGMARSWVPPVIKVHIQPSISCKKCPAACASAPPQQGRRITALKASQGKELLQKIESYRLEEEIESGTIIVEPLTERWIPELTDLLVDTFRSSLGYKGMRAQIFRMEILSYLSGSLTLGDAGVVLVAILQPNESFTYPVDVQSSGPKFQGFMWTPDPSEAAASPSEKKGLLQSLFGTSGGASLPKKSISSQDFRKDLDALDTPDQASIKRTPDSELEYPQSAGGLAENSDDCEGVLTNVQIVEQIPPSSLGDEEDSPVNEPGIVQADKAILLGTAEVSLDSSTRQSFFGLVNPVKDGAYVCNVAVASSFQRKGHATRMMMATEEIARLAGLKDLYVQARLDDEGPQMLYRRFGFQEEKDSNIFNAILGGGRKMLMRKKLRQ